MLQPIIQCHVTTNYSLLIATIYVIWIVHLAYKKREVKGSSLVFALFFISVFYLFSWSFWTDDQLLFLRFTRWYEQRDLSPKYNFFLLWHSTKRNKDLFWLYHFYPIHSVLKSPCYIFSKIIYTQYILVYYYI